MSMKMVSENEIIGATIVEASCWGNIVVEKDGVEYVIKIEEGYSGPENNIYKK